MAIKMRAVDSFYSDATTPNQVHIGTEYTVESDALADQHEKKRQGRRVEAKAEKPPKNKAEKPPKNK